jgi:hypothetical protein
MRFTDGQDLVCCFRNPLPRIGAALQRLPTGREALGILASENVRGVLLDRALHLPDGGAVGQDDAVPQDFPLPLPARPIVFGKRKRHYFCDHHLSLVADRDKSGFVLFCFAHHIARTKCSLEILDLLVCSCVKQFCEHLRRWKQIQNHLES